MWIRSTEIKPDCRHREPGKVSTDADLQMILADLGTEFLDECAGSLDSIDFIIDQISDRVGHHDHHVLAQAGTVFQPLSTSPMPLKTILTWLMPRAAYRSMIAGYSLMPSGLSLSREGNWMKSRFPTFSKGCRCPVAERGGAV